MKAIMSGSRTILITAVLTCFPLATMAGLKEVKVGIGGLDNEFCAYSLGKKLTLLDGVKKTSVDCKASSATLTLEDTKPFQLSSIETMLTKNKFNLKKIQLNATGRIVKKGNTFIFDIEKHPYQIYLFHDEGKKQAPPKKMSWTKKIKEKASSLFNKVVSKISAEDKFEKTVKTLYQKNASLEITCNIHRHRDGFLLGLADHQVEVKELPSNPPRMLAKK